MSQDCKRTQVRWILSIVSPAIFKRKNKVEMSNGRTDIGVLCTLLPGARQVDIYNLPLGHTSMRKIPCHIHAFRNVPLLKFEGVILQHLTKLLRGRLVFIGNEKPIT